MSKTGEEGKVSPPPQFDEDGNPIGVEDDSQTSKAPTLAELMKKLKKLKAKEKKGKMYSSLEGWSSCLRWCRFPKEDEQPTSDQIQKIHRNAQAITIITSSVDKIEFN
jgi:hypothetical protein